MRSVIKLGVVAFCVTLGVVVGNRMSSEAMAVVVGVVCGVLASIPMSVLLLLVVRRSTQHSPSPPPQQPQQHYPPVVVVNPGGQQLPGAQQQDPWVDGQWRPAEETPRFRMLGES